MKRAATEYITKDHGSTPNPGDVSEERPKMANAAQLARRKLAPKSRLNRPANPPPPSLNGSAAPSNPFSSTGFGQIQQEPSQLFQNSGNGTSFGASSSFPAASGSSQQFNFSVPGESSSFTFGQAAPNNPFASMNGGTSGNVDTVPDNNMMDASPQKPTTTAFAFGSNSGSVPTNGFSFGQSLSQPTPAFGGGQTNGFNGSLFGQPKPQEPKPDTSNIFGQLNGGLHKNESTSTTAVGNPQSGQVQSPSFNFGQVNQTSSPESSPFKFTQPLEQPASTTSPQLFNFGNSVSKPSPTESQSSFKFGDSISKPAPSEPQSSSFKFGETNNESKPTLFNFGQTQTTAQPSFGAASGSSNSHSTKSLFGDAPTTSSTNNLFGSLSTNKAEEPRAKLNQANSFDSSTSTSSLFRKPSPGPMDVPKSLEAAEQPKTNPFGSLFGPPSNKADTAPAVTAKPLFNFGSTSQTSAPAFGSASEASLPALATTSTLAPKSIFSFGAPTSSSSNETSSLSSPAKPVNSLFGNSSTSKSTDTSANSAGDSIDQPSVSTPKKDGTPSLNNSGIFGTKPASSNPDAGTSKLFGSPAEPSSQQSTHTPESVSNTEPRKELFPALQSASKLDNSNSSRKNVSQSDPKLFSTKEVTSSSNATLLTDDLQRTVSTNGPPQIPPYLTAEKYRSYDGNYRLHSLNREFQQRIATLDPVRHDFDNIIRNYIAARESIGASIGIHTRDKVGTKRKEMDIDEFQNGDSQNKKQKATNPSSSFNFQSSISKVDSATPQHSKLSAATSMPNNSFASLENNHLAKAPPTASATGSAETSALFRSMIPGAQSSTANATIPPPNPFANLFPASVSSESPTPSPLSPEKTTTPSSSPPKKAGFQMPTFAPVKGINFMEAFAKKSESNAAKFAKEEREKRKAEDFDSDEDDEEEWNKKYEEEQRQKRAKIEGIAKVGFVPSFGSKPATSTNSTSSFGSIPPKATENASTTKNIFGSLNLTKSEPQASTSDQSNNLSDQDQTGDEQDSDRYEEFNDDRDGENDDEEVEDSLPEDVVDGEADEEDSGDDINAAIQQSKTRGPSLFDRVSRPETQDKGSAVEKKTDTTATQPSSNPTFSSSLFGSNFQKSSPETPSFSPITPATVGQTPKDTFVPAKTFNFTPAPSNTTSTFSPGASVFSGGVTRDGPIPGEGLFGSRPSTPSNADNTKPSVFGTSSSNLDNTWKRGSEIKFGTPDKQTPVLNITDATPTSKNPNPFGSLFGASTTPKVNPSTENGNTLGFGFGSSLSTPAPGFLAAASHLGGVLGTNSGLSSRATSPGLTDNESVATDNTEDYSTEPQTFLMMANPGEEHEDVLFESKAKAMRYYKEEEIKGTKLILGWNPVGVGNMRILKHKETNKTRIVLRAEPGANILLNTNLLSAMKYESVLQGKQGSVKFGVSANGKMQSWLLKVKSKEVADEIATILEANKAN